MVCSLYKTRQSDGRWAARGHSTPGGAARKIPGMFLPNRHGLWFRLIFMALAAGLFFGGYLWGNQQQRRHAQPPTIGGILLRPPGAIPGFRLQDPAGRVFDQRSLAAGWTLLTFGDLADARGQRAVAGLIDLYNRVADQPDLHRALRLVLVTEGPPDALARDYAALSPALFVLGGAGAEAGRLREALGVGAGLGLGPGAAAAPPLFVVAPGGALIALFTGDADRARTALDLAALHAHFDPRLPEAP